MATVSTMATADVVIEQAKARMRAAAELFARGRAELGKAQAALERHPDFGKTAAARRRRRFGPMTPAWWLHECIRSVQCDSRVVEAAVHLRDDASTAERTMRTLIDAEARDEAARRRAGVTAAA